ncbi:TPA: hypothetical protein H1011_02865 [archaeon]|uniref:DNA-binding protein n=1 Tax=Candidatus Undinarchaeum marinum TaxID=2756141 RepID=A0A832V0B2_9ARCH|nr:hypothetical protein [Candidatus Undinarchaeum marinum]
MDDSELEKIRRQKLTEMQAASEQEEVRAYQEAQAKNQVESVLKLILTQKAWDRWNNAKMANQNVAYSAAMSILQQTRGKVTQKISEEELKKILSQVASSQRREFNITRK